jgi:NADPH:quinone reductase-like Zn-dependent oxidoreductase
MKAYATDGFGEMGTIRDFPLPEPGPGEVRVRVAAAGMNPVDNSILQGYLKDMVEHRFPLILGIDASGIIEAVADGVDAWSVGDAVFGVSGKPYFGAGTYAEYVTMAAGSIAHKPSPVGDEQAAAIPTAGVTALMLVEALDLQPSQRVLAIGAAGGVGSYFVQLAAHRGSRVIAVSRAVNGDYVRSLGAEDLIDYSAENVGEAIDSRYPEGIDAVADLVGNQEQWVGALAHVRAGGRVASTVGAVDEEALSQRGLTGQNIRAVVTTERLDLLASARASGELRDPEIKVIPLEDATDALARLAAKRVRGKLVLKP